MVLSICSCAGKFLLSPRITDRDSSRFFVLDFDSSCSSQQHVSSLSLQYIRALESFHIRLELIVRVRQIDWKFVFFFFFVPKFIEILPMKGTTLWKTERKPVLTILTGDLLDSRSSRMHFVMLRLLRLMRLLRLLRWLSSCPKPHH